MSLSLRSDIYQWWFGPSTRSETRHAAIHTELHSSALGSAFEARDVHFQTAHTTCCLAWVVEISSLSQAEAGAARVRLRIEFLAIKLEKKIPEESVCICQAPPPAPPVALSP